MPKFRTYSKLYEHGKPVGRAFVYHRELTAKTKEEAKKILDKQNASWNKAAVNKKRGYTAKTYKVVRLTDKGTIKSRKKRTPTRKQTIGFEGLW